MPTPPFRERTSQWIGSNSTVEAGFTLRCWVTPGGMNPIPTLNRPSSASSSPKVFAGQRPVNEARSSCQSHSPGEELLAAFSSRSRQGSVGFPDWRPLDGLPVNEQDARRATRNDEVQLVAFGERSCPIDKHHGHPLTLAVTCKVLTNSSEVEVHPKLSSITASVAS